MKDPFSVLTHRLRELATSAAKTVDWITANTMPIPALIGLNVEVSSNTTVDVTLRGEPYGWLELADDAQSYIVWGVDLDDPSEKHRVADNKITMPVGILALIDWHEALTALAADAARIAATAEDPDLVEEPPPLPDDPGPEEPPLPPDPIPEAPA